MELLDLYDNNGKLLNKTIVRGNKNFEENENIKLATIWIKSNNKYLIQKTSKEKGGEYAVSGGHVQAGLTSKQQACLELEEELLVYSLCYAVKRTVSFFLRAQNLRGKEKI